MDRIWRELMVLKAMQKSDFEAMIVGFKSLKGTISSVQQSVTAVQQSVTAVQQSVTAVQQSLTSVEISVTSLEETMLKNQEHQASRLDKIEEAVKLLDETKEDRASGSS